MKLTVYLIGVIDSLDVLCGITFLGVFVCGLVLLLVHFEELLEINGWIIVAYFTVMLISGLGTIFIPSQQTIAAMITTNPNASPDLIQWAQEFQEKSKCSRYRNNTGAD